MNRFKFTKVLLILLTVTPIFSQSKDFILKELKNLYSEKLEFQNSESSNSNTLSRMKIVYEYFISEQDMNRCEFFPSCSHYLMEAVKKNGLIKGFMLSGDRLMRGGNKLMYEQLINGKFLDIVE